MSGEGFGENGTDLRDSKAEDKAPKRAATAGIYAREQIGRRFFTHAFEGGEFFVG